jgi:regulator of sigma E protease
MGAQHVWYEATSIFQQLQILFSKLLNGDNGLANIVGPVGLVSVVGDASSHGIGYLLGLIGVISVNLAVINLIPIPALDGGRLALLGVEAVIRRPAPRGVVSLLNASGVLIMIALMITVTYQDIARLLA